MTIINWTLIGLYSLFMLCVVDDTIRDVSNGIISKRKAFVYLFFVVSLMPQNPFYADQLDDYQYYILLVMLPVLP